MNVIETDQLSKCFTSGWFRRSSMQALDRLNLQVPAGSIFGFLGPNGAGKSTTIKILLGLVHPTAGSATLLGESIHNDKVREKVGYLPENPAFPGHLRAAEFLKVMGKAYHMPAEVIAARVEQTLQRVGLADRAKSSISEFSRGMLQRLGIAQAMLNTPQLVILDEPLNGLDPYGRRELKNIFLDLKAAGCTIFFSSHILSDVQGLCDWVAILNRGQLIAAMPTRQLLEQSPGLDLEEIFFQRVDQDNRNRFGQQAAEQSLAALRMESASG